MLARFGRGPLPPLEGSGDATDLIEINEPLPALSTVDLERRRELGTRSHRSGLGSLLACVSASALVFCASAAALMALVVHYRGEPVPPAAVSVEVANAGPLPQSRVTSAEPVAPALQTVQTVPAVPRLVNASAARRECMTQVESANLFLHIARQAPSRGAFDLAVNRETKRLLQERQVAASTLHAIAAEMWTRRQRPEQVQQWWTQQYQNCEGRRLAGLNYVVRSE